MWETLTSENMTGVHFVLRWLHVFFGIIWIGHLYYFNFVQGAFMAESDAAVKSQVLQKLAPRAMWWFRWAAMWTFATGFLMLSIRGHQDGSGGGNILATPYWINILTGSFIATLMFLNVWGLIWQKQKIVFANAAAVAGGAAPNPLAAPAAARALVASRTNVVFSIPMLFFMLSGWHFLYTVDESSNLTAYWIAVFLLIFGLQANAMFGKTGPITTVKGVITGGFILTAVLVAINAIFI